ncbi:hypothetical protein Tco_1235019 [Tanacetum coccineum]
MSMDDLYMNLKVYEPEVKGMSSSSSSTQNMAFVSSSNNNTSSSNEAVNAAYGVSTTSTQDLQQIHPDDIEEIDLRWQMAMLTIRARRFLKNTRKRKLTVLMDNETLGLISQKWSATTATRGGHFSRECRAPRNQDNKNKESSRRSSDQAEEGPNYALMAYSSSSSNSKGNLQMDLKDQGVIDSGCSRHMTGNMSYLLNYKETDGEYGAFGGNHKVGKIIRKANKSVKLMMEKLFGMELELMLVTES